MLIPALGIILAASASFAWHDGYVPSASKVSDKLGAWLRGAGATFQGVTNSANDGVLNARSVEPVPAPIVSRSEAFNPFEEQTAAISEGQIEVKPIIPPAPVSTVAEPRPATRQPEETEAEVNAGRSLPEEIFLRSIQRWEHRVFPRAFLAPVTRLWGKFLLLRPPLLLAG